jgi:methylglutaconyl-CoA hydratase
MPSDAVEVRVDGQVATIALNRPDNGNALTRSMVQALREALGDLHLEKRARAVILTGMGDSFCIGRDLVEETAAEHDPADLKRWGEEADEYRELLVTMVEFPKPILAAVNGPALASGAGLVLGCDVVVASNAAQLGFIEPHLGAVAGVAAPLLAYRVGAGAAARLLVTAETIAAQEAYRLGLYHELIEADLVWARANELGNQCAMAAPQAIGLTKRLMYETIGEGLATQLTSGAIATATARTTDSAREGLAARLADRKPEWP